MSKLHHQGPKLSIFETIPGDENKVILIWLPVHRLTFEFEILSTILNSFRIWNSSLGWVFWWKIRSQKILWECSFKSNHLLNPN
jgi:hypothetical protein